MRKAATSSGVLVGVCEALDRGLGDAGDHGGRTAARLRSLSAITTRPSVTVMIGLTDGVGPHHGPRRGEAAALAEVLEAIRGHEQ